MCESCRGLIGPVLGQPALTLQLSLEPAAPGCLVPTAASSQPDGGGRKWIARESWQLPRPGNWSWQGSAWGLTPPPRGALS